jgi:hypothetical protein
MPGSRAQDGWWNAPQAEVWRGAPCADWPEHFRRITGVYPDNTEKQEHSNGIEMSELYPGGWVVHHFDDGSHSIGKLVVTP